MAPTEYLTQEQQNIYSSQKIVCKIITCMQKDKHKVNMYTINLEKYWHGVLRSIIYEELLEIHQR